MKKNTLHCNICGHTIKMVKGIQREDFLCVEKEWGYFSEKDGITHKFIICEKCYDKMIKKFEIPVQEYSTKELI